MSYLQSVQADAGFSTYTANSASTYYTVSGFDGREDEQRIATTERKILAAKSGRNANAPKDAQRFLDWLNR